MAKKKTNVARANVPATEDVNVGVSVNGLKLGGNAKSRAIYALDQLVGGILEVPAAWLQGKAMRVRQSALNHAALSAAEAEAAIARLTDDPAFGMRTVEGYVRTLARKQHNKEEVARKAVEELQMLPAPEVDEAVEQGPEQIDSDWFNVFHGHAENASSDDLQRLWARVLAGEIRKPGSFSRVTLRIISELDQSTASHFQEVVRARLPNGLIPKPNLQNEELLKFISLEERGLLQDVHGFLAATFVKGEDGNWFFFNHDMTLRVRGVRRELKVPVVKITLAGREIAEILPKESSSFALREVAKMIQGDVSEIYLTRIEDSAGGTRGFDVECLFRAEEKA